MKPFAFLWVLLGLVVSCWGETCVYDFTTTTGDLKDGATVPANWSYTSIGKSDGVAAFNAVDDAMRSPIYNGVVTNVALVCKCSNLTCQRTLKIIPLIVAEDGTTTDLTDSTAALTVVDEKTEQAVAFPLALGANAFRVRLEGPGSGNWTLYSATVVQTGEGVRTTVEAPADVTTSNVSSNACTLAWTAVSGVTRYLVSVSTNAVSPAVAGTTVWTETFSQVPQGETELPSGTLTAMSDWKFWTYSYLFYTTNGAAVRIGNTSYRGTLSTGPLGLTNDDITLFVTAWREEGRNMPVEVLNGSTTNLAADIALTQTRATYTLPLPAFTASNGLVFHSTTNAQRGRVYLDDVSLVSGYRPATTAAVEVACHEVSTNVCDLANLAGGSVQVRVAAVNGSLTNWSEVVEVDLTQSTTPRYWRVSEFVKGTQTADFSWLATVSQKTSWTNGETLRGFSAFKDDGTIDSIAYDTGKAYIGGIYSSWTNDTAVPPALALLGSGSTGVAVELAIQNDTAKTVSELDLSFLVRQTTLEENVRTLDCAYAVTAAPATRPQTADWQEVDEAGYESTTTGTVPVSAQKSAKLDGFSVRPGETILIRWSVAKQTNSPMLGIANVSVGIRYRPEPSVIFIR